MIADAAGRAIAFRIAPGQAHELPHAVPLLDRLPGVPRWVIGDRGYTSHTFREHIWSIEPPRVFRRLRLLRGWSHDEAKPTFFT